MKSHHTRKSGYAFPYALKMFGSIAAVCSLLISALGTANATSISGESKTIFRMGESTENRKLYPLYEYLRLSGTDTDEHGTVSFNIGGWGRIDLRDKSTDKYQDGDLQYGYLSFQSNRNNLLFNAGRQFVAEGVATEKLDGLYLRSDIAAGFGGAVFVGTPVVTEPNFNGGDIVYGGRIAHSMAKYYTVGISAVKSENSGSRLREEEGVDLWLYPVKHVDVVGRSSYNSLTSGWMEHAYTVSYTPLENLRINADLSNINYRDYFHHVTTRALSLTNGILDPGEKVLTLGGSIGYTPVKDLSLSADYKNYDYDIAGHANYFGGKATFSQPESLTAGFSIHRMDGESDKLRYDEYRVFASKKLGKADVTLDFFDVNYDSPINGIKNAYSVTAAAGYEIATNLKVAADIDYSKSPDFDNEVRGQVKLSYAFDAKFGTEGRAKSEK